MLPIGGTLLFYAFHSFKGKPALEQKVSSKLEIVLGVNLIGKAEALHSALPALRKTIQQRVGITLGHISITDSIEISPNSYALQLRSVKLYQGREREVNEIVCKLEELFERHAHELITRQDVARLLSDAKQSDSACVDDLKMNHAQLLTILQALLKERIPITDFVTILETLAKNPAEPISACRESLVHSITSKFFGNERIAHVVTVDPKVEKMLQVANKLRPRTLDKISAVVSKLVEKAEAKPVLLTTSKARVQLRSIMEKKLPDLPILSYDEVDSDIELRAVGTISNEVLL